MKDGLNEEQRKIIEEVERQVPLILKLPEPGRSKCIVCLSYEYLIQDMEEKAFSLLESADPNYFKDPMKKDMEKDPRMAELVMTMLSKIISMGYVDLQGTEAPKEETVTKDEK